MDHTKAYEMIGSLSASINAALLAIELSEQFPSFRHTYLERAKGTLLAAQGTYEKFTKDAGWDTQGEK